MTRYLLDTNVLSDAVRNPDGPVDRFLRANLDQEIGVSVVVKGEILFGLKRNSNVKGRQRLDVLLDAIAVWPLDSPVDETYGAVRAGMERQGHVMGPNDLWIAAHALALEATLVTDDRAFLRVPGLKVENWLRDTPADRE